MEALAPARQLYMTHISLTNDLYSYSKEVLEMKDGGALVNGVHILQSLLGVCPNTAKVILRNILWSIENQLDQMYETLNSPASSVKTSSDSFEEWLKVWQGIRSIQPLPIATRVWFLDLLLNDHGSIVDFSFILWITGWNLGGPPEIRWHSLEANMISAAMLSLVRSYSLYMPCCFYSTLILEIVI